MRRMVRCTVIRTMALAATVASVVMGGTAGAQTWLWLPNGPAFQTPYTFTGAFACGSFTGFVGANCTNTASGVHLTSGTATMDLAFTGTSGTLTTSPAGSIPLTLGTVSVTTGGSGTFAFPNYVTGYDQWFFQLAITGAGLGTMPYHFYSTGPTDAITAGGGVYLDQRITQQLPGYNYPEMIYTGPASITIGPNAATFPLVAQVGAVPEPSSLALLGTGLLAIAPAVLRKRMS